MEDTVSNAAIYKCRKCRVFLFEGDYVVDAHGMTLSDTEDLIPVKPEVSEDLSGCATLTGKETVWYLRDDNLPTWAGNLINEGNWIKGKLTCPKCKARIGSFDYVGGAKCSCGKYVLPAVHVVKGKIDRERTGLPPEYAIVTRTLEKHEAESSREVSTTKPVAKSCDSSLQRTSALCN